jgi:hypothetical protein
MSRLGRLLLRASGAEPGGALLSVTAWIRRHDDNSNAQSDSADSPRAPCQRSASKEERGVSTRGHVQVAAPETFQDSIDDTLVGVSPPVAGKGHDARHGCNVGETSVKPRPDLTGRSRQAHLRRSSTEPFACRAGSREHARTPHCVLSATAYAPRHCHMDPGLPASRPRERSAPQHEKRPCSQSMARPRPQRLHLQSPCLVVGVPAKRTV